jgi:hypothetical protein
LESHTGARILANGTPAAPSVKLLAIKGHGFLWYMLEVSPPEVIAHAGSGRSRIDIGSPHPSPDVIEMYRAKV